MGYLMAMGKFARKDILNLSIAEHSEPRILFQSRETRTKRTREGDNPQVAPISADFELGTEN